jgi:aspartate racemase
MKKLGLIGGIAPESTIEYYRRIIASYREQVRDDSYPALVINSIDLTRMLGLVQAGNTRELVSYLVNELRTLVAAGAQVGAFCSNTPHIVFDEIQSESPIPLVSIVEAACREAQRLALKRVGLFGTRFTMNGKTYRSVFGQAGITIVTPNSDEQTYIHERYLGEIALGVFLPETRERLLSIAARMKQREKIDGLILGGTELPLLLRQPSHDGMPLLDTTGIHVKALVAAMLP